MILPPPSSGLSLPPTRFALKARPFFIGLLATQGLLMVLRFIILDIWGALLSLLILTMGFFVLCTGAGMDSGFCLYFGLMCLINGVFDAILFIERAIHVKYSVFSKEAPWAFNLASFVFLLCPLVEVAAATLSAAIYMDASEHERALLMPHYSSPGMVENSQGNGNGQRNEGFQAFTGRGYHI
eukprot:TRINITY_DN1471_c1_g1_i1.p1 TRINITY_DN1471_c1_g1~~TRINITY_DN1471_c1_g1_i1.p1  ORF type:complete len:183 (+),score=17.53 TRINITY_DN1471_c1_g1_i1:203-751(+)